eukprot:2684966-Amphidinium_carterae.1
MRSRPYDLLIGGRPYPQLVKDQVVYRSEKGNGTYPLSIVPRFSDVTDRKPGRIRDDDWLRTREIRRAEERKALFEQTTFLRPDSYKWGDEGEKLSYQPGIDITLTPCPRWQWHVTCMHKMREACYPGPEGLPPDVRCYVCNKGPDQLVELARCLACNNVYMCNEHRIFPDCIHSSNAIPI